MISDIVQEHIENNPELLTMTGYDDCILGICERFGMEPVIAYDKNKVLTKLQSDGMNEEEAIEWFEYNQIGAWVGDYTPVFISV